VAYSIFKSSTVNATIFQTCAKHLNLGIKNTFSIPIEGLTMTFSELRVLSLCYCLVAIVCVPGLAQSKKSVSPPSISPSSTQVEEIRARVKDILSREYFRCTIHKSSKTPNEPKTEYAATLSAKDLVEVGNDLAEPATRWALVSDAANGEATLRSEHDFSGSNVDPKNSENRATVHKKTVQVFTFDLTLRSLKRLERRFWSHLKMVENKKTTVIQSTSDVVCVPSQPPTELPR